jgi:hypothetical protein
VSNRLAADVFTSRAKPIENTDNKGPAWLRQVDKGRESIMGSLQSFDDGLGLLGVTAYVFDS